jgi:mannosyltransferase
VATVLESPILPPGDPSSPDQSTVLGTRVLVGAATATVLVALFLRFYVRSDLWLDEALSVNIAKLPLTRIPGALRHDGSPPLYYVLLHFWMRIFGQSDFAVRFLSGLASVAALPAAAAAGRRLAGRRGAIAALMVLATSPFAIGYATSARMYSFMMLWTLIGVLVLVRALEEPTSRRLIPVGVLTAVIIYTHYWGLYLVLLVGAWLVHEMLRATATPRQSEAEQREIHRRVLVAMAAGCLTFLPWAPSFIFQALHTGTPWTTGAGFGDILGVLSEYAGDGPWGITLGLCLFGLLMLGLFGRPIDGRHILLELRTRRRARPAAGIFIGTLALAVCASGSMGAAFVGRYTAGVFPLFILVVALGVALFADRRVMAGVLAVVCGSGLAVAIGVAGTNRTEARNVAAVLNQKAQPNDIVVYCPAQLGPAVDRLVRQPLNELTFPHALGPQRLDWVDYRTAIRRTNVAAFAEQVTQRAGAGHAIWYVWGSGYPGLGESCTKLLDRLTILRPGAQSVVPVTASAPLIGVFGVKLEEEALVRFPG